MELHDDNIGRKKKLQKSTDRNNRCRCGKNPIDDLWMTLCNICMSLAKILRLLLFRGWSPLSFLVTGCTFLVYFLMTRAVRATRVNEWKE
mmetsp:Transcript_1674/g.2690  ORF Transcript_1674/g.2690 Transcript_1674/m.2690 type:complete len:90 (+) Transcript_1674:582-851(+)